MSDSTEPASEQPRGTLIIVTVFGILVVLGWMLFYFGLYLPRNTP